MHSRRTALVAALSALLLLVSFSGVAAAGGTATYRITLLNMAAGQALTPPLLALHKAKVDVFSVGEPASFGVKEIAENGNLEPLYLSLGSTKGVGSVAMGSEPLVPIGSPGQVDHGFTNTVTIEITAPKNAKRLTWVSMLICTNDGFTGVDGLKLPKKVGGTAARYTNAYDAGTEVNTESFADIVPPCRVLIGGAGSGGSGMSDGAIAEGGVIHHHAGIVGGADLDPGTYGWTDPVGLIVVERIG